MGDADWVVLLVEDLGLYARKIMELLGADVVVRHALTLADAEMALRLRTPVLAIIDVGLPDGDGMALAERLARKADGPDIVVLTADVTREIGRRGTLTRIECIEKGSLSREELTTTLGDRFRRACIRARGTEERKLSVALNSIV